MRSASGDQKQEGEKMKKVEDKTMDAIVVLMDSDLREKVHFEIAPCSNEEFLKRYCELNPQFESVLKSEFGIEL